MELSPLGENVSFADHAQPWGAKCGLQAVCCWHPGLWKQQPEILLSVVGLWKGSRLMASGCWAEEACSMLGVCGGLGMQVGWFVRNRSYQETVNYRNKPLGVSRSTSEKCWFILPPLVWLMYRGYEFMFISSVALTKPVFILNSFCII